MLLGKKVRIAESFYVLPRLQPFCEVMAQKWSATTVRAGFARHQ